MASFLFYLINIHAPLLRLGWYLVLCDSVMNQETRHQLGQSGGATSTTEELKFSTTVGAWVCETVF